MDRQAREPNPSPTASLSKKLAGHWLVKHFIISLCSLNSNAIICVNISKRGTVRDIFSIFTKQMLFPAYDIFTKSF